MRDWLIVNWLSFVAFLVSLTALIFAYSAYKHVSPSVAGGPTSVVATEGGGSLPKITFLTGEDRNAGQAGIEMKNGGPGPAIIKSVDYFIDGRHMEGEEAVIDVAPRDARRALQYTHLDPGARLGANAGTWLLFLPKYDARPREYERLAGFLSDSVAVDVKYCSEQNACADACSKNGACGAQK